MNLKLSLQEIIEVTQPILHCSDKLYLLGGAEEGQSVALQRPEIADSGQSCGVPSAQIAGRS